MAKGNPESIVAAFNAVNPPPINKIAATNPSIDAQNIFCPFGASCRPPEVSVSTTKDPESEDVIKKLATSIMVTTEVKVVKGYCSNK